MPKKILVIDDSMTVRKNLKLLLSKYFTIKEAEDGMDALEVTQATPDLDLFICDINMPRMDGLEFVKELRKIERYSDTPVLMVTTESAQDLVLTAKELGVKGWIIKPFNRERVIAAIKRILKV